MTQFRQGDPQLAFHQGVRSTARNFAPAGSAIKRIFGLGMGFMVLIGPVATASDGFLGIGYGASHSDREAAQASIGFGKQFETHVSIWNGPQRNRVLSGGVRLPVTPKVSVYLGAAYLERETGNIQQGLNGASELRLHIAKRWTCQLSHYSGEGSDASDNLLLCGYLWQRNW